MNAMPTVSATDPVAEAEPEPRPRLRISSWRLMRTFAVVGICAFGGVMPWIYREVVDKQKWVDKREFAEMWSVCMLLPGATSTNLAAALGYRLAGLRGATASALGLLGPPFVIVLLMAGLYNRYGTVPAVHGAVRGATAVAGGLVFATALKLALGQPRRLTLPVFALAAFLGVTVLGWSLLAVVATLVPLSVLLEWRASR